MNDRELLELAAKAACLPECGFMGDSFMYVKDNTFTEWNPLVSDADAFRLAVALKIDLMQYDGDEDFKHPEPYACADYLFDEPYEANAGDAFAATRRAIVRAAAQVELGRLEKYRG